MGVVGLVLVVVDVVVAAFEVVVGIVVEVLLAALTAVAATMAAWVLDMVAAVARAGSRPLAPRCATTSAVDMVFGGEGAGPGLFSTEGRTMGSAAMMGRHWRMANGEWQIANSRRERRDWQKHHVTTSRRRDG
jgi:hypothetical protein